MPPRSRKCRPAFGHQCQQTPAPSPHGVQSLDCCSERSATRRRTLPSADRAGNTARASWEGSIADFHIDLDHWLRASKPRRRGFGEGAGTPQARPALPASALTGRCRALSSKRVRTRAEAEGSAGVRVAGPCSARAICTNRLRTRSGRVSGRRSPRRHRRPLERRGSAPRRGRWIAAPAMSRTPSRTLSDRRATTRRRRRGRRGLTPLPC